MIITRTPVRISFAGGGTDLPVYYTKYGGLVLSVAINKYIYTILTEREDNFIQVISSDLQRMVELDRIDLSDEALVSSDLNIPLAVLKHLKCQRGLNIFVASEIPPGTGLGSSGSVCVNMLKIVSHYLNIPMSRYDLAETAFFIASALLKRPVGKQDEYAAAFGGLNMITFDISGSTSVHRLPVDPALLDALEQRLLLFFTGQSHNSAEILTQQRVETEKGRQATLKALHGLKELVNEMQRALLRDQLDLFGELLDKGWQMKRKISDRISNPRIDRLYALAKKNGALGGKITGAGGGGFLLFYSRPEDQARLRKVMADQGLREMRFKFDYQGAQLVYDNPFFSAGGRGEM
ncbi:MAG: hypothetical protein ABIL05_02845, partial [candidate division WOR-3 bacterium]